MASLEVLLPGEEVFDGDGGEGSEFGPFVEGLGLDYFFFFEFSGPALHQVLMDPASGFLDDVVDNGAIVVVEEDFVYLFVDVVDVVAGDAGDGLDFVVEGREGVLL